MVMRGLDGQLKDQVVSSAGGAAKRLADDSDDDADDGKRKGGAAKKARGAGVAAQRQGVLAKAKEDLKIALGKEEARVAAEERRAGRLESALSALAGEVKHVDVVVDYMAEIKRKVAERGASPEEVKAILRAVAVQLAKPNEVLLRSVLGQLDDDELDLDFILDLLKS